MVDIRTGDGRFVYCKWCNHPLTLQSKTDYVKCVNCGGVYNGPMDIKIKFKSRYTFYYFFNLFFGRIV